MFTQKKSPSCIKQGFHLYRHKGVLKGNTPHTLTSEWFTKRLITWIIIYILVDKSIFSYVYIFI